MYLSGVMIGCYCFFYWMEVVVNGKVVLKFDFGFFEGWMVFIEGVVFGGFLLLEIVVDVLV